MHTPFCHRGHIRSGCSQIANWDDPKGTADATAPIAYLYTGDEVCKKAHGDTPTGGGVATSLRSGR